MENEKQNLANAEEYNEQAQQADENLTVEELDEVSGGLARRMAEHAILNEVVGRNGPQLRRSIKAS